MVNRGRTSWADSHVDTRNSGYVIVEYMQIAASNPLEDYQSLGQTLLTTTKATLHRSALFIVPPTTIVCDAKLDKAEAWIMNTCIVKHVPWYAPDSNWTHTIARYIPWPLVMLFGMKVHAGYLHHADLKVFATHQGIAGALHPPGREVRRFSCKRLYMYPNFAILCHLIGGQILHPCT